MRTSCSRTSRSPTEHRRDRQQAIRSGPRQGETMTMSAGTKDVSAMQKMHGLRTNVLGFPALFAQSVALISPTMTAVLIIPLAFAERGTGHVVGLRLRHHHAALRGLLPEPVRQAVLLCGLHVRLHRQGTRAERGRVLRLDLDLGLLLHCRGGPVRLRRVLRTAALGARVPRLGPSDRLLRHQRGGLLGDRLQGHPRLVHPDPGLRGRLRRLHHGPGLRDPVQARLHGGHEAALAERRRRAGHGPGRRRLHLLARRLRERHDARRRGEEPTPQRAHGRSSPA